MNVGGAKRERKVNKEPNFLVVVFILFVLLANPWLQNETKSKINKQIYGEKHVGLHSSGAHEMGEGESLNSLLVSALIFQFLISS